MLQMVKVHPPLMTIAGDILVKNMDFPGAQELADRIRKALPPEIQFDEDSDQEISPEVQTQLQGMYTQIQELTNRAQEMTQVIETKKQELESKERIEDNKLTSKKYSEEMKLQFKSMELQAEMLQKKTELQSEGERQEMIRKIDALSNILEERLFGEPIK
jgi:DNA repair ATPase RecN